MTCEKALYVLTLEYPTFAFIGEFCFPQVPNSLSGAEVELWIHNPDIEGSSLAGV